MADRIRVLLTEEEVDKRINEVAAKSARIMQESRST